MIRSKALVKGVKTFAGKLGPGFITGAADDDPSAIGTYAQTGAQFGYSQLWLALFSIPLMSVIQEVSARIGLVTGKGISKVIKEHYSKKVLFFIISLLFIANTITIGADLGVMASSAQLIIKEIPFTVWLFAITLFILLLEIFISYKAYSKILKYLTLALLTYIIAAFSLQQEWQKIVAATLIPSISFTKDYLINVVAFLGTTISPYAFFWQANEEVEEEKIQHKLRHGIPIISFKDIRNLRIDTISGMFFSNLITFFIMITCAASLNKQGIFQIDTVDQIAVTLKPIIGEFSSLLFTIGIFGAGLLAIPVLAGSASYAVSEGLNFKTGLNKKFNKAHGFYGIIILATLIGVFMNFTPIKPVQLLYLTSVFNGVIQPPLLIIIMLIGGNKKIMGEYTTKGLLKVLGWLLVLIMSTVSLAVLATVFLK